MGNLSPPKDERLCCLWFCGAQDLAVRTETGNNQDEGGDGGLEKASTRRRDILADKREGN